MDSRQWKDEENGRQWWRHVSGPKSMVKAFEVEAEIKHCIAVDMEVPDEVFLQMIKERLANRLGSSVIFDILQDCPAGNEDELADYLGSRYQPGWIPSPVDPCGSLAEKKVLRQRVVFLPVKDGDAPWISVAADHFTRKAGGESGLLVLFGSHPDMYFKSTAVSILKQETFISAYDVQYFALQCLKSRGYGDLQRQYIGGLASRIAGTDGLLCEAIVGRGLYEDPEKCCRQNAGDFPALQNLTKHPDRLRSLVWETQITTFLPIFERIRRYLVDTYRADLERIAATHIVDEFGHEIITPEDMELRHIQHYYVKNGGMGSADLDLFRLAYNARNDLSHMQCLPASRMDEIFQTVHLVKNKF